MFMWMNMKDSIYDRNHWRQRAEQAQAKADQTRRDANLKRELLRAAEERDRLAQLAEHWQAADKA
jgi:hypothetical protein